MGTRHFKLSFKPQGGLNNFRTKYIFLLYKHLRTTVCWGVLCNILSTFPPTLSYSPVIVIVSVLATSEQTERGLKQENHIEEIVLTGLCRAALLIQHTQGISDCILWKNVSRVKSIQCQIQGLLNSKKSSLLYPSPFTLILQMQLRRRGHSSCSLNSKF